MAAPPAGAVPQPRLASLDQFRGYTVAGMFLVNYLGYFAAAPFILKHHNTYCSYADTIMPGFFFAVGFAMRLSFERRVQRQGLTKAYGHMIIRLIGLALVAIFITYQAGPHLEEGAKFDWATVKDLSWGDLLGDAAKREWFQTLMHIAVTSLWILPVLRLSAIWRVLYMIVSAAMHVFLSDVFYFNWVNGIVANGVTQFTTGIDGGPLGFLTWTIPTMVGTLACDVMMSPKSGGGGKFTRVFGWGLVLMAIGWIFSCGTRWSDVPEIARKGFTQQNFAHNPVMPTNEKFESWKDDLRAGKWSRVLAEPPFVPPPHSADPQTDSSKEEKTVDKSSYERKWNYWMMSQRAGSISYQTFGAGFSLALYGLFFLLSDVAGLRIGIFRTLGTNALVAYILHDITGESVKKFVPKDVPPNVMWISFAVFFFVTWLFIRSLERQKIYIKL